jgi:hypothetical protein
MAWQAGEVADQDDTDADRADAADGADTEAGADAAGGADAAAGDLAGGADDPTSRVTIDPGDFDAVGLLGEVVVSLRRHALERHVDVVAVVSAPPGRHRLTINARPGGHVVLGVRYVDLSLSRLNVIAEALGRRGWDLDEDADGATYRFPPGTEHTTVAFEALAVLTVGGTPPVPRTVIATDAAGAPVRLD